MLCFRCEVRASFLEGGMQPRMECGDIKNSKVGCYMFKPCKPVIMKKASGDPRPAHGGYIGARMYAIGLADNCVLVNTTKGWLAWAEK